MNFPELNERERERERESAFLSRRQSHEGDARGYHLERVYKNDVTTPDEYISHFRLIMKYVKNVLHFHHVTLCYIRYVCCVVLCCVVL